MTSKRSPWQTEGVWPQAATEPLDRDLTADVCVVGAGMAGLLCALELSQRGHSVIVLEREAVAAGATGATTAHLTAVLDTRYHALAHMHGEDAARLAALSHLRAIAYLERLSNAFGIECDFRRLSGFLCAGNEEQAETLHREHEAASAAGLRCELVRRSPLPLTDGLALHVPHQAAFDPLAFLAGVVLALQARGVRIYAPITVQEFDAVSATDQIGLRTSEGHSIRANYVVVATNTPINDVAVMHTKQAAYRSYGLSFASRGVVPGLGWDMEDPYHFVRSGVDAVTHRPVLIVGGADHRVGQDLDGEHHWYQLEGWTRDRFPGAGEVVSRWSGQVFEPSDGLAYIGRNPGQERVFIVTGQSGNGMTYSAISAELIADLVDGIPNAFETIYEPARKPSSMTAIGRFVRENLNVAEQYTDWLGPADVTRLEEIPRGEGAVLRRGLTRVAVYVDPGGVPHELSATCPHLGGVVAWNSAEKSWDCPCHGSRFDCHGKVVSGPAVTDLRPHSAVEPTAEKAG